MAVLMNWFGKNTGYFGVDINLLGFQKVTFNWSFIQLRNQQTTSSLTSMTLESTFDLTI